MLIINILFTKQIFSLSSLIVPCYHVTLMQIELWKTCISLYTQNRWLSLAVNRCGCYPPVKMLNRHALWFKFLFLFSKILFDFAYQNSNGSILSQEPADVSTSMYVHCSIHPQDIFMNTCVGSVANFSRTTHHSSKAFCSIFLHPCWPGCS